MHTFDFIAIASQFQGDGVTLSESLQATEPDKTAFALDLAKRQSEIKKPEPVAVSLAAVPIAN